MDILSKKCIPCSIGADPLSKGQINKLMKELEDGWNVVDNKKIEKTYKFKNFKEALDFAVKVGNLAESEGHHPDINISWGKVILELWTKKIDGLHENDFILAAKIDQIERI